MTKRMTGRMTKRVTGRTAGRTSRSATVAVVACAVVAVWPGAPATASAGSAAGVDAAGGGLGAGVERISVASDGTQADDASAGASITPDGRHVVFASSAKNLTSDTSTGGDKVFVRDRRTGQTGRIGYLTTLQPPAISGDGEHVAYPVQWMNDVRIRQYQVSTGRTISADCSAHSCNQPSLGADGRHIALAIRFKAPLSGQRVEVQDWNTGAKQTVADLGHTLPSRPSLSGDARRLAYQDAQAEDVFVWDRTGGTAPGPIEGPAKAASLVQLSDDGGKVVYLSGSDTYVHDMSSGTAQQVPDARGVAIDPTGRYLLYVPQATGGPSLVLRDLRTGTDETISDRPATAGADAVSADGRDVVFQSAADDIVPGDTNGKPDVFVRHLY
ncbi:MULTISPECIES: hypothetical protein [unclassified Streptomyces]|uniref:TolB family protein n=1 Tax=unclassified Streptomyces TaxID=2593676 RepID=UPI0033D3E516